VLQVLAFNGGRGIQERALIVADAGDENSAGRVAAVNGRTGRQLRPCCSNIEQFAANRAFVPRTKSRVKRPRRHDANELSRSRIRP